MLKVGAHFGHKWDKSEDFFQIRLITFWFGLKSREFVQYKTNLTYFGPNLTSQKY